MVSRPAMNHRARCTTEVPRIDELLSGANVLTLLMVRFTEEPSVPGHIIPWYQEAITEGPSIRILRSGASDKHHVRWPNMYLCPVRAHRKPWSKLRDYTGLSPFYSI
jgi:hypothetical protein